MFLDRETSELYTIQAELLYKLRTIHTNVSALVTTGSENALRGCLCIWSVNIDPYHQSPTLVSTNGLSDNHPPIRGATHWAELSLFQQDLVSLPRRRPKSGAPFLSHSPNTPFRAVRRLGWFAFFRWQMHPRLRVRSAVSRQMSNTHCANQY